MSIAHKKLSIVSGRDLVSEEAVLDAFGVRIANEVTELFHADTYVGKQPVLKATFAGSEVVLDEPIDTDWPAQSFVPVGLFVFAAQSDTTRVSSGFLPALV